MSPAVAAVLCFDAKLIGIFAPSSPACWPVLKVIRLQHQPRLPVAGRGPDPMGPPEPSASYCHCSGSGSSGPHRHGSTGWAAVPVVAVGVIEPLAHTGRLRVGVDGDGEAAAIGKLACLAAHGLQPPRTIQVFSSMP